MTVLEGRSLISRATVNLLSFRRERIEILSEVDTRPRVFVLARVLICRNELRAIRAPMITGGVFNVNFIAIEANVLKPRKGCI